MTQFLLLSLSRGMSTHSVSILVSSHGTGMCLTVFTEFLAIELSPEKETAIGNNKYTKKKANSVVLSLLTNFTD
jgi:hypothetical protein